MRCPICKTLEQYSGIELQVTGFAEQINTCRICGTVWAVHHGATTIVKDPQKKSFLSALSECVGADEYSFAA